MTDAPQVEIGKSTAEPWDVGLMNINDGHGRDAHCLVVVSGVTKRIVCSVSPSDLVDAEDAGNACLLSAAPDLLAACSGIIAMHAAMKDRCGYSHIENEAIDKCRIAIAKANGEQ